MSRRRTEKELTKFYRDNTRKYRERWLTLCDKATLDQEEIKRLREINLSLAGSLERLVMGLGVKNG